MDFEQVIKTRRSIRKYKSKRVPREVVDKILKDAVTYAPSAKNLQPWKFIVIADPQQRQELVSQFNNNSFIREAPYIIVGLANQETCYPKNVGYLPTDLIDFSIVFYQLLLSATNEGLATCWLGAFDGKKIEKHLGISRPWRVIGMTPLGYGDEPGSYHPRKAYEDAIEWR